MKIPVGTKVRIKPEYQDEGDDKITFIVVEGEDGGRITIEAQLGMPINPRERIDVNCVEVCR